METIRLTIEKKDTFHSQAKGLDEIAFSQLASAFPKLYPYNRDISFYGLVDANCPVPQLISHLVDQGIDVYDPITGPLGYYITRHRNYTPEQLAEADYLYDPVLSEGLGRATSPYTTNESGMPVLDRTMAPLSRLIGTARSPVTVGCMVCRGQVIEKLSELNLNGLHLIEAPVSNRSEIEIDRCVRVIWSNRELPLALNLMTMDRGLCEYSQLVPEERDVWLSEGFISPPELHYNRAALAKVGDFDLALAREQTRFNGQLVAHLVVSRRFCELMHSEFGLTVTGIPVRLRDDSQIPWAGPYPAGWEQFNKRPACLVEFETARARPDFS
jgi:hypothetical protein